MAISLPINGGDPNYIPIPGTILQVLVTNRVGSPFLGCEKKPVKPKFIWPFFAGVFFTPGLPIYVRPFIGALTITPWKTIGPGCTLVLHPITETWRKRASQNRKPSVWFCMRINCHQLSSPWLWSTVRTCTCRDVPPESLLSSRFSLCFALLLFEVRIPPMLGTKWRITELVSSNSVPFFYGIFHWLVQLQGNEGSCLHHTLTKMIASHPLNLWLEIVG